MLAEDLEHCKVTEDGVAHLFRDLDFGGVCACGRKVFAFGLQAERPGLFDTPGMPLHGTFPLRGSRGVTAAADLLMARGAMALQRAHALRGLGIVGHAQAIVAATRRIRASSEDIRRRARQARRECLAMSVTPGGS